MTISDAERREAAENLRYLSDGNRVRYKEEFFELLDETVMEPNTGYHEMNDVFDRLADLIDRPTCHDVADFDRESFKCSRCGFRVLSIDGAPDAAKLVGTKGGVVDFGYCPNCGERVVRCDE